MSKRFVLKMQLSEFPYEKRVLIYNKNKTIIIDTAIYKCFPFFLT